MKEAWLAANGMNRRALPLGYEGLRREWIFWLSRVSELVVVAARVDRGGMQSAHPAVSS